MMTAKDLDTWLDEVNYKSLNHSTVMPSEFSLIFMNFIKLVNGEEGESNKTPPMHLFMLDRVTSPRQYIANLCFRGSGKTSIFAEYMYLFIGVFGSIPGLGETTGAIYVSDSIENGVKSLKDSISARYDSSEFLQKYIPKANFTATKLLMESKTGKKLGINMYGAQTGIRGNKIFAKRPTLAVLDDLLGDQDAASPTIRKNIEDTVYKGVNHALDPTKRKIILNGTPFNKDDILIKAIESGAWEVNVWPVCERFPCSREEFNGAWEDRFTYDFIKNQYDLAVKTGHLEAFNQELMLRISSAEDRLVREEDINWYSRENLLKNKHKYNFYVTTDFAVSSRQTSDYTVISVWAFDEKENWHYVDGICARQTMDITIEDLFRLVAVYQPQEVGVEISGQQAGFIPWIQQEMQRRNVWFNFASSNNGVPGIRPIENKLARFNRVLPWFKAGRFWFPTEWKTGELLGTFLGQIRLITKNGIKGKDDAIDTVSQLSYLTPWKPTALPPVERQVPQDSIYDEVTMLQGPDSPMDSYVV